MTQPSQHGARRARPRARALSSRDYAALSAGSLLIALAILLFVVLRGRELIALGLHDYVFYVLLIVMGVSAAFALFGAMRSVATVKGEAWSMTVELGGPVALLALVVVGGFRLVPRTDSIDFAVMLRTATGAPAAQGGRLRLVLDRQSSTMPVDSDGRALFENIPFHFREQDQRVELVADGWVFDDGRTSRTIRVTDGSIVLVVSRDISICCVRGTVTTEAGTPIANAMVRAGESTAYTESDGHYQVRIPPEHRPEPQSITVTKAGFESWTSTVELDSTPLNVVMVRQGSR